MSLSISQIETVRLFYEGAAPVDVDVENACGSDRRGVRPGLANFFTAVTPTERENFLAACGYGQDRAQNALERSPIKRKQPRRCERGEAVPGLFTPPGFLRRFAQAKHKASRRPRADESALCSETAPAPLGASGFRRSACRSESRTDIVQEYMETS